MAKEEKEVLHETPYFEVVMNKEMYGVEVADLAVVVMPFEKDKKGLPKSVGILKEYNPMRRGDYSKTLVTGRAEGEDPDVLSTAMRELKEESGYDVTDPDRWYYLGMMTTSKLVDQELPCFAVDVTDIEIGEAEGDGTESEEKSEFTMMSVKEALDTDDCFIPTVFMKIFKYIFGFDLDVNTSSVEDRLNYIKKKLDITYLNIEGVNGSILRYDLHGNPYIEYTVKEITDDIKELIKPITDGVNVVYKLSETAIEALNKESTEDTPEEDLNTEEPNNKEE